MAGGRAVRAKPGSRPAAPSASTAPLFLWLVPAALLHALLAVAMAAAGVASLGLKRWGRRTLVGVATADLVLQALVLLTGLAWVAPAMRSQHFASGAAAARPALEAAAGTQWLVLWFALSVFPAVVVGVLARWQVPRRMTSPPIPLPPPPSRRTSWSILTSNPGVQCQCAGCGTV